MENKSIEEKVTQLWNNVLAKIRDTGKESNNNNINQSDLLAYPNHIQVSNKKYTILLPPPNITGSLHIGHFLNWSIQDLLMRKAYIDGLRPNWIAGIDHAGIATQFVVERELAKEGVTRQALGREKFSQKIWEWKKIAEDLISQQALSFGFFFDWENKRFTMDEDYQQHVTNAFVKLFNDGLIKKSQRITNWDVQFQTALSDLEVIEKIETRPMYIIAYHAKDYTQTGHKLEIGTTRPETMFADAAVCVHPDDERFKHLHGKTFLIPLINKEIPLILDEACSMEKGTGALKITPAHDMADNSTSMRHNLECIQIINKAGCMFGDTIPGKYVGKTTLEARGMVIEDLTNKGYLIETREHEGIVYYPEKSTQPIETIMTEQWFLDVASMAQQALAREKEIEFIPQNIKNTFEHWMTNIRPWCISRQIWWGHRLPIWYTKDGETICAHDEAEAVKTAGTNELTQETDVLDTWFSSALWPIATQKDFAPTDILVTGKDILFFWVARMIMFTLYFKNDIPFKCVYFNGIVRDKQRQKMSKTKGNVLNPLDLKEEYGNDALRFALLKQASWGKDILIETKDIEDGRAFCTKIRNATKFITTFMSKEYKPNDMLDNWISTKILQSSEKISQAIAECAFHEACTLLYDLFWNNFCAWYVEGCKIAPSLHAQEFLATILKIMHPILPWISEECFQQMDIMEGSVLDYHIPDFVSAESNFEQIISITKLLRKLAFVGECKEFNLEIDYESKNFIKFYTKLSINNELDCSFNMYGTKIFITSECAKKARESMQKELSVCNAEASLLQQRITKANNVPEEVLSEWEERFEGLQESRKFLEEYINSTQ